MNTLLEDIRDWIKNANIFDSTWLFQLNVFEDDAKHTGGYVVIRGDGGTARTKDLSAEQYVMVQIVSNKKSKAIAYTNTVKLLDYAIETDSYGQAMQIISNEGLPNPILTEDLRHVYMITFRILFTD